MHADEQSDGHDLEEQLRQLTADLRNLRGSTKADAQRLVQLEIGIQNLRECSKSDPLWNIVLIVALSTCIFIILQSSRTRLLLDAAPNRGVERKKKIGPQFGPDVGRSTSVWDHPG